MSEQDTRRQLIDPKLREAGWEVTEDSRIITERYFTNGRLTQTGRQAQSRYDYVLIYKNVKLAVVEAKKSGMSYGDAVGQVKDYNESLKLPLPMLLMVMKFVRCITLVMIVTNKMLIIFSLLKRCTKRHLQRILKQKML